jgi:hypothetical protein
MHITEWTATLQHTCHDDLDACVTARDSDVSAGVLSALPTTPRSFGSLFDTTAERDSINAGALLV